ncbi:AraC-like DNA-binding protein [Rhizobium sp. BK650]|uniref:AraC family transcriptional regulator n=1 Tax=Rhizobium sp. BK650 TaxID=2586990 RepID=UPI0016143123|nr:AraC family transcriptional regulator [Rhizobium sp. BK650]MBB3659187.1 AraC-like DNA-binding protein [Rhizobium sp. BK650]
MNLLETVRRHADAHVDRFGAASTPIAGLTAIRATAPSELQFAINRPLVALVLQGRKRVSIGSTTYDFGAGESLLISADVPTVSQITSASRAAPYYSLVLELDLAMIRELNREIGASGSAGTLPVNVDPTQIEVADIAARLMALIDRPSALSVLVKQHLREMHFWLMMGKHGAAIRALGQMDSHAGRVARAVALIRDGFARPLRVHELAEAAGMSLSSFHEHFRAVTTLSPLQFQKQLRLIEARRKMVHEGLPASSAAYAVGYESITQFSREYARQFGAPPARDLRNARINAA